MRAVHVAVATLSASLLAASTPADARQPGRPGPQGPGGTVTLPVADYDRLLDRAARPIATPELPPIPAVAGRAELRARVEGTTARGTLRMEGEVFQRGSVRVPLVAGATLLEARADGRPLPLLSDGEMHVAVLAGPAPFTVTLEWAAPVGATPGRASFALPQPASASGTAIVDLPGDPADVQVQPGLVTRRQTAAGRTVVEIALASNARTEVSWSVRDSAPPPQAQPAEARTLAEVKSLLTIGDGDVRMASLVDITVVRGEPRTFEVLIPAGYQVAAVSGGAIESSETKGNAITLHVREPSRRRHQALITLERPNARGSFKMDTSFPIVSGVQRESGEAAIEGTVTIDVNATGDEALRRMDVREVNAALRSLARQPLLAAFRYQRRPNEARRLTLDVTRFADAAAITAASDEATATTLVTSEGRMLTEISLRVRNRAQPFMKVTLPAAATLLSVEVAGETAKPVEGTDGTRIPLLRAGFRPNGPYTVSFVYLHGTQRFEKRGEAAVPLARVDVPVGILEWELFLPEQYSAKPIAGNVIPAHLVSVADSVAGVPAGSDTYLSFADNAAPGTIAGRLTDAAGGVLPGVAVSLALEGRTIQAAVTDASGMYAFNGVPSGRVTVMFGLAGFRAASRSFVYDQQARRLDVQLQLNALTETVTVQAESDTRAARTPPPPPAAAQQAPPQNVLNMQRRVAGVLPVRIDVPRAGTAYRFYRPLVLDEETTVSFRYKRR